MYADTVNPPIKPLPKGNRSKMDTLYGTICSMHKTYSTTDKLAAPHFIDTHSCCKEVTDTCPTLTWKSRSSSYST